MNKRNIDVIYDEAIHCGIFNLVWLPVMAGICFFQKRRYEHGLRKRILKDSASA